jgi:metal-dependent amidase/aminoacylase/carboxypeptidase family protein
LLNGTIRALSAARRETVIDALERITHGIAAAHRCTASIETYGTTPCTNNTPDLAAYVAEVTRQVLSERAYFPLPLPVMWGEDFAFYLQQVPGCFYALGVKPHDRAEYPMLHNPHYDFTDAALLPGVRMMCELAVRFGRRA